MQRNHRSIIRDQCDTAWFGAKWGALLQHFRAGGTALAWEAEKSVYRQYE